MTINSLPTAGNSFFSDLDTFLQEEDADRFKDMFTSFIVSGGLGATAGSLTHTPTPLTAYPGGHFITETGSMTYPDDTTHIWVICHKDTTAPITNWTRESGTHYLFRNTGSGSTPTLPDPDTALLMKVTTLSGSITAVQDARVFSTIIGFTGTAVDNALVKLDGTAGDLLQPTGITIDDSDNMTTPGTVDGRDLAADGTKLDGIETAADVTDATNVAAAGAVMDSDISEAEGILRKTGAGTYVGMKTNLSASVDPTATDDSNSGYAVGSIWINTTKKAVFQAIDVTVSSAVWLSLVERFLLETIVASDDPTIEFDTNVDFSGFEKYEIDLIDIVPAVDNTDLYVRTSTDGGTIYDSGGSDYEWQYDVRNGGSTVSVNDGADAKINITRVVATNGWGNAAGESFNGTIFLFNPSGTNNTQLNFKFSGIAALLGLLIGIEGEPMRDSAANVDGIQFLMSTGNITSGTFKIYGIN